MASPPMSSTPNGLSNSANTGLTSPDPSVAGPGVLFGFIFSGLVTFVASLALIWVKRLRKTEHKEPAFLRRLTPKRYDVNPAAFWREVLENFVLQLSDQQIVTSAVLLICALAKYWRPSVRPGTRNLFTAADIVIFSSFTHVATLFALRSYFRKHYQIATIRAVIMYTIYVLWIVIAICELQPEKVMDCVKKRTALGNYWSATMVLEGLYTPLLYLAAYLPTFASKQGIEVRHVISRNDGHDSHIIEHWIEERQRRLHIGLEGTWKFYGGGYGVLFHFCDYCGLKFARAFVKSRMQWQRWMLWVIAELFWPCYIAQILLSGVWLYSLIAITVSLAESGIASMEWDFGQLLPAVLVVLPVQSLVSSIADARYKMVDSKLSSPTSEMPSKRFKRKPYSQILLNPVEVVTEIGPLPAMTWQTVELENTEVSEVQNSV